MRLTAFAAIAAPALLVTACGTGNVETLRNSNVSGTSFDHKLAAEYRGFSTYELDEMVDTADANYFAEKGLRALQGQRVAPEDPATRKIAHAEKAAELQAARGRLVNALANGAAEKVPGPAARAQVNYDCWVEQQEEGFQYNDIAACRNGFMRAMQVVETGIREKPVAQQAQPAQPAPAVRDYRVFFDWDSAQVTGEAEEVLRKAAENARQEGITVIRIVGHTDRSGPPDYNMQLSQRRAQAIAQKLREFGVNTRDVAVTGRGETEPLVETGDGVREVQNRRVQIVTGSRTDVGA